MPRMRGKGEKKGLARRRRKAGTKKRPSPRQTWMRQLSHQKRRCGQGVHTACATGLGSDEDRIAKKYRHHSQNRPAHNAHALLLYCMPCQESHSCPCALLRVLPKGVATEHVHGEETLMPLSLRRCLQRQTLKRSKDCQGPVVH
eukprot:scaffold5846_cov17-Tisochrysis_lutea.AAC.1